MPSAHLDELAAWVRLTSTPKVGAAALRRLLAAFGSPQRVLSAPAGARQAVAGEAAAAALAREPASFSRLWTQTVAWLEGAPTGVARDIIPLGDPRYPDILLHAAGPPLLLYAEGRLPLLQATSVAIVGSRNATPAGLGHARVFAGELAGAGLTVVSGLALGVDAAAHTGALAHPAGTVAVVGTGLDIVYPKQHGPLAERIRHTGLLISEHPLGTTPQPSHFPRRNRIIAGMTRGTLVVEAALASGSLITARLAAESGREVFAVPGSIHAPQSRGCHALLKQGAKLVETTADILEELNWTAPAQTPSPAGAPVLSAPDVLLDALAHDPVDLDTLVARTGETAPALTARLLQLEFEGRVARLPGQRFQRLSPG
jgi:DNA processing protein